MAQVAYAYPTPTDIGMRVPRNLRAERFNTGFHHGVRGGQLDQVEYFRLSFRLGFRAAKLYLREVRRKQGIREFPLRVRIRLKAIARF